MWYYQTEGTQAGHLSNTEGVADWVVLTVTGSEMTRPSLFTAGCKVISNAYMHVILMWSDKV